MQTETQEAPLTQEVTPEAPPIAPDADETEPQTAAPPAQISPEIETKARDMGWVPQSEWRGSPDAWRPADQFVKRGEEVLPIVKSRADRAERKVHELETAVRDLPTKIRAELEQTYSDRFKRLEGMTRIALEKQRDVLWTAGEEKKRAAVADGNMQAYEEAVQSQRKALAEFQPEAEVEEAITREPPKSNGTTPQPTGQAPPAVRDWVETNTWFNRDPVMTAFATEEHGRMLKEMPGLSIAENLERTTEAVKAKFPERFGIAPQPKPTASAHAPSVEGGGRQAQASASRAKGWNDLPPEAKDAGNHFIKDDGLFLPKGVSIEDASEADIKKARDDYARRYWS